MSHSFNGEVERPRVSCEFLARHKIRHIDADEANVLVGYKQSGILIPYLNPFSNSGQFLVVNRKQFSRLRLDRPTSSAKYLSPQGCGVQLYVPLGAPFQNALVVTEGEFKALSLAQRGIRSVGIGGLNSAMPEGKLLPKLAEILRKYPITTLCFLGDADTCYNFAFAREAIKIANALPPSCRLLLPRIPVNMPNGIDDVAESLAGDFLSFWQHICESAIDVSKKQTASTLARQIAERELGAIASFDEDDRDIAIGRLAELCSQLSAIDVTTFSEKVEECLDVDAKDFRKTASGFGKERRHAAAARRSEENIPEILNDERPKIELPGSSNRLVSDFAIEIAPFLTSGGIFVKDSLLVRPDMEKSNLVLIDAQCLRTLIERWLVPFKIMRGTVIKFHTLVASDASALPQCVQLIERLPKIRAVSNVRLPVLRESGAIELLQEGYDAESMIFTRSDANAAIDEEITASEGVAVLKDLYGEFCFKKEDAERAMSVSVAAQLTLFCFHLLPKGANRPGFVYTANAEGAAKTLLARIAIVPRIGYTPVSALPEREEEIDKMLFSVMLAGGSVVLFDNGKRHLASGSIEGAMTSQTKKGRPLGHSRIVDAENMLTFFFTGNGATFSPDLRRRTLKIELSLKESRAEDREIKRVLNEEKLVAMRSEILSALWAITRDWARAGSPAPATKLADYGAWSDVICGIIEHAKLASPCTKEVGASTTGDTDLEEMEKLVAILVEQKKQVGFGELIGICIAKGFFTRILGDDSQELEKGEKNKFSKLLTRFNERTFKSVGSFHVDRSGQHPFFYAKACQ